jgi:RNA polymerase sigma factor (sigma-70 family)
LKQQISLLSDNELIALYKLHSDRTLVGELYKRYSGFCFAVSMKYLKDEDDSSDAVMSVFERLFDLLKQHNIEYFKPWLYSVVKNHCLLELRKGKMFSRHTDENRISENVMENRAFVYQDTDVFPEERLQELENAIPELSMEQRTCIELFYLQDKSYQEVSHITGYDMKKVKSYIQNGKRNLKIMLETKKNEQ